MKTSVYADNAATTELDPDAFEAMTPYFLEEYGNPSQPYTFARAPKTALHEARATIADCIGALPEEIYFTSGGTESDNWSIKGSLFAKSKKTGVITSAFEHHAVLHSCQAMERLGYPVVYLQPDKAGIVEPATLQEHMTRDFKTVSIMFANNEIGVIQPIRELCEIAHAFGAVFHTDAVQAVGHVPVDVATIGVDLLSVSAHKFNGPKGIGFLYIKKGTNIAPYADGGAQERKYRAGTENVPLIVGMATALKKNCSNMQKNADHILGLERQLLERLNCAGIVYSRNGSKNTLPGLLSLSFPGASGEAILHRMDLQGIAISTGSACDSQNTKISHVLRSIQLDEASAKGTIRISLGRNNTAEDVERIVYALVKTVSVK